MTKSQAKLLIEELENKKLYEANWGTECDCCDGDIQQGDKFVFMGDKKKVCIDCVADMQDDLEENYT